MSFYLKYELSRLLHADGAKTFQAIEKSTRRNVLLHLVDKSASPQIVEQVKKLQVGQDRELVEVGEFAGSYYVVTAEIQDFQGLTNWLDRRISGVRTQPMVEPPLRAPAAPQTAPTMPAPAPDKQPGEFTKLFSGGADAVGTKPDFAAKPPPTAPTFIDSPLASPPLRAPAPPPPADEPGEFTQLFGGDGEQDRRFSEPVPQAAAGGASAAPSSGGEFTRLFGGQPAAAPPAPTAPPRQPAPPQFTPAPPSARESDGGDFTRRFSVQSAPPAPPKPPAEPAPPAPPLRPAEPTKPEPGEFTRLFGGQPSAPASPGKSGFTDMFGPADSAPSAPVSPPPASGGTPLQKSSGEFTQLFGESSGRENAVPRLKPVNSQPSGDIEKSSGEFTRLFGLSGKGSSQSKTPTPSTPSTRPPAPPAMREGSLGSSVDAPGEFTLMFGRGQSHSSTDYGAGKGPIAPQKPAASFGEGLVGEISGDEALSPDMGPRVSKSSKPFQAPGEFTRMFGPSDPSHRPPEDFIPAAQKGGPEGYASGLFRNPHAEPRQPARSQAGGGAAPPNAGPGDYTMRFERGSAGPAQIPKPAAPPPGAVEIPAPAPSKPGKGMLIALIAAVLVAGLALGAAVYLFLNRSSDAPEQSQPPAAEQPANPGQSGGN